MRFADDPPKRSLTGKVQAKLLHSVHYRGPKGAVRLVHIFAYEAAPVRGEGAPAWWQDRRQVQREYRFDDDRTVAQAGQNGSLLDPRDGSLWFRV